MTSTMKFLNTIYILSKSGDSYGTYVSLHNSITLFMQYRRYPTGGAFFVERYFLLWSSYTPLPPSSSPQITPETSVGEIVEEVTTNKSLPPDHYALYLVIGEGDSYRVLSSSDRLLAALSSVGSDCHLCLKPNNFYESIKPFVSSCSIKLRQTHINSVYRKSRILMWRDSV